MSGDSWQKTLVSPDAIVQNLFQVIEGIEQGKPVDRGTILELAKQNLAIAVRYKALIGLLDQYGALEPNTEKAG